MGHGRPDSEAPQSGGQSVKVLRVPAYRDLETARCLLIAAARQDIYRHSLPRTAKRNVDLGSAKRKTAQGHLVEEGGEYRAREGNAAARRFEAEPKATPQQRQRRRCRQACGAHATG
jgi:hypothetical protein